MVYIIIYSVYKILINYIMDIKNSPYSWTNDVEPDLQLFYYKDAKDKIRFSKNGVFIDQVVIRNVFTDRENPKEVGYYQWNHLINLNTHVYTGLAVLFLEKGTISFNIVFKRPIEPFSEGPYNFFCEILSGTEHYLGVRGLAILVMNAPCNFNGINIDNPIDSFNIYFDKSIK